jgi:hypothetical protein
LNEAWQAVSAELYKQAQQHAKGGAGGAAGPAPQPGGPAGETKPDEGPIIDAEVVDDSKK